MSNIFKQLARLQDLQFAHLEKQSLLHNKEFIKIEDSINIILRNLPDEVAYQYKKLQKHYKNPVVVVSVEMGCCAGCRISLPTTLVQEIISRKKIHFCPNCSRIIIYREEPGMLTKKLIKKGSGIGRFSSPQLVLPNLKAETRDSVLLELIQTIVKAGLTNKPEELLEKAIEREEMVSTAVSSSLAFPHVRTKGLDRLCFVMGIKKRGLRFNPENRKLIKIIFFTIIPPTAGNFYLQLIGSFMNVLKSTESRKALLAEKTKDGLWTTFNNLTKDIIT
ncbi:MAG: PTS sugar transporter subunit IIA [Thermodesulfobacteriota bacterium]|nr:PTS sugar transporter subunit IIA [Thermodesulfobacteriota bacterium]